MPEALVLRELTKRYGDLLAVNQLSLAVNKGEFITLLGPSGCGKTTTLRMVAGFLEPTRGRIEIDGKDITPVPAYRRDIGMVFQNYALFPHMSVGENISFPLRMRHISKIEIGRRVADVLSLVSLEGSENRLPRQLSGGQQQRVALARALVFRPRVLLMDEPLGALDKKLREWLQSEIRRLHAELGITVLYVTHDQEEALAMSDRIAILRGGRIEQLGTGQQLYEHPQSLFVAQFMGESNIFEGLVERNGRQLVLRSELGFLPIGTNSGGTRGTIGAKAAIVLRPEKMHVFSPGTGPQPDHVAIKARLRREFYLGSTRKYELETADGHLAIARRPSTDLTMDLASGDEVSLHWNVEDGVLVGGID